MDKLMKHRMETEHTERFMQTILDEGPIHIIAVLWSSDTSIPVLGLGKYKIVRGFGPLGLRFSSAWGLRLQVIFLVNSFWEPQLLQQGPYESHMIFTTCRL